ncbi:MAG TPA: energy transducer TonB, partial [Gemmatimonadales bacterium]|nr:energy transducer TonB [Gemmatimonadales bacterium]
AALRATADGELTVSHAVELIPFFDPPVIADPPPGLPAPRGSAAGSIAAPFRMTEPVSVPLSVLSGIPPVALERSLDPAALRRWASGGPGVPGGTDSVAAGRVLAIAEVDEPASVIRQLSPRYPPVLQRAGIAGKVLLEFIIDTTGHPEPASLRVLERSAPGFDLAALEAIQHSLFRPARVRGKPVRQRTLQSIMFRIVPE